MQHQLLDLILVLLALAGFLGWLVQAYRHQMSEDRLHDSEKGETRYQAMIEDQKDMICRWDADGTRIFANEAYCRFYNKSREELIGTPVGSFLSEADANAFKQSLADLSWESPTVEFEYAAIRHDGMRRWLNWTNIGIFDGQGGLVECHGVGRDVTERRRTEEALKESEKRLRLFSDAMPALFSYIDKDRRYRFCNLAYEKHFRRRRNQIVGHTIDEINGPDTCKQLEPVLGRVLAGENVFFEQWVDYREAGRTFVRGSLIPDISPAGEVVGFFAMIQDMTGEKRSEDNLARAKEQAEMTSASKSRFLAAASHDLRQPMQALAMFVDVLAGRQHDAVSGEIISKIQASSKSLQELLNGLLDISKLEADLVVPETRRFTIGELTARLAEEIEPLAQRKGLELVHVPSTLSVRSDPGLLDRVLRNLLVNAVTNTRHGRIVFGCRRRGEHAWVEVWDTGTGIPEDQRERIFEEFYQGEEEDGILRNGLGLGLAIVERLLKLLNHTIEVSQPPSGGSVFRVRVPIDEGGVAVADHKEAVRDAFEDATGALVVGIDDDPAVRDALSLLLESWGFTTVTAASSREAMERLAEENRAPDLVIADYRLQQGNKGSHAIRDIQERWGEKIPGLLLTGDIEPGRLQEATASGYQVIQKPIQPDKLKTVVAEQIDSGD
ncbi:MAG: PAS domain S-box protein [Rhodospirillales bacterium]|nr:PAS domain S-box protein [Alphaproteobacteria bacterium]MBL6947597.1 PAS domain S-box protein [Rhodospirillales bacterium]